MAATVNQCLLEVESTPVSYRSNQQGEENYSSNEISLRSNGNTKAERRCITSWSVILLLVILVFVIIVMVMTTVLTVLFAQQCTTQSLGNALRQNNVTTGLAHNNQQELKKIASKLEEITQLLSVNYTSMVHDGFGSTQSKHDGMVEILANIRSMITETNGVANDLLGKVWITMNQSLLFSSHVALSCKDIKQKQPWSTSGYYHINSQLVYCEMGELCGSDDGGWTRLGYMDMSDATTECPDNFKLYTYGGTRSCGRPYKTSGSCASVKYPSNGVSYSEVCGKVIGYQYGNTEAARNSHPYDINSYYVDGVSITRGSPRQHVWTLMAGSTTSPNGYGGKCPCNHPMPNDQVVQNFVGDDYYCESSNSGSPSSSHFNGNDPLWDGMDCDQPESSCCSPVDLPWFHKTFDTTDDYIELRSCGDHRTSYENVLVNLVEIYVK